MILVIDNFDSFTYNLVQLLRSAGRPVLVRRNNDASIPEIEALSPSSILISPGPGRPEDAGASMEVIRTFAPRLPLLGVCLGHQAIARVFGADVTHAPAPMHGKLSSVRHDGAGVFRGLPNPFAATRYHSLVVDPSSIPAQLRVTAVTPDGVIMGIRHRSLPVEGVQFHPEAVLTEHGEALIANWLAEQK